MLIDTSGWYCVLVEEDRLHETAASHYKNARRRLTHSFVIDELVSLCDSRRFPRTRTLEFISELLNDPDISIIWVDESLTLEAFDLLRNRLDKRWSLCDAVSFVLMTYNKINVGLTTDHHFEQAGF